MEDLLNTIERALERDIRYAGQSAKAPEMPTMTDKAIEVMRLASRIDATLAGLESRLLTPSAEKASVVNPPPDPEHIVFVLEATEVRLIGVANRLESLLAQV